MVTAGERPAGAAVSPIWPRGAGGIRAGAGVPRRPPSGPGPEGARIRRETASVRSGRKASDPRGPQNRVSVLDEILDGVRADLAERQRRSPLDQLKEMAARGAVAARRDGRARGEDVAVIAEVKRSSPSKGALAAIADPAALAARLRGRRRARHQRAHRAAPVRRQPRRPGRRPRARSTCRCCARTSWSAPTSSGRPGRTAPTWSC